MKSSAAPQEHILVHSYGSRELKEKMERNTLHAFLITNIFLSLIFLIMILRPPIPLTKINLQRIGGMKLIHEVPTVIIDWQKLPVTTQSGSNNGNGPIHGIGTRSVAGNYKAVNNLPDSLINRRIAAFGDKTISLAISGSAINPVKLSTGFGGGGLVLSNNFKLRMPEPYEPTYAESEPEVDLAQISRLVEYPKEAKEKGIEGLVKVRVLVGEDGTAKRAIIEVAADDILNAAAISAVLKAKYTPAKQNKYNVPCWISIPINFSLKKY